MQVVSPPTIADSGNQPFPDQHDDLDIDEANFLDMSAPGPRDFVPTKEDKLDFRVISTIFAKATGGRFLD